MAKHTNVTTLERAINENFFNPLLERVGIALNRASTENMGRLLFDKNESFTNYAHETTQDSNDPESLFVADLTTYVDANSFLRSHTKEFARNLTMETIKTLGRGFTDIYNPLIDLYGHTVKVKDFNIRSSDLTSSADDVRKIAKIAADTILDRYQDAIHIRDSIDEVKELLVSVLPIQEEYATQNVDFNLAIDKLNDEDARKKLIIQLVACNLKQQMMYDEVTSGEEIERKISSLLEKYDIDANLTDITTAAMPLFRMDHNPGTKIEANRNEESKKYRNILVKVGERHLAQKTSKTDSTENDDAITDQEPNLEDQLRDQVRTLLIEECERKIDDTMILHPDPDKEEVYKSLRENYLEIVSRDEYVDFVIEKGGIEVEDFSPSQNEITKAMDDLQQESIDHVDKNRVNYKIIEKMTSRFKEIYTAIIGKLNSSQSTEEFVDTLIKCRTNLSAKSGAVKQILGALISTVPAVPAKAAGYALKYKKMSLEGELTADEKNIKIQYQTAAVSVSVSEPSQLENLQASNTMEPPAVEPRYSIIKDAKPINQTIDGLPKNMENGDKYGDQNKIIRIVRDSVANMYEQHGFDTELDETNVEERIKNLFNRIFLKVNVDDWNYLDYVQDSMNYVGTILIESIENRDVGILENELEMLETYFNEKSRLSKFISEFDEFKIERFGVDGSIGDLEDIEDEDLEEEPPAGGDQPEPIQLTEPEPVIVREYTTPEGRAGGDYISTIVEEAQDRLNKKIESLFDRSRGTTSVDIRARGKQLARQRAIFPPKRNGNYLIEQKVGEAARAINSHVLRSKFDETGEGIPLMDHLRLKVLYGEQVYNKALAQVLGPETKFTSHGSRQYLTAASR